MKPLSQAMLNFATILSIIDHGEWTNFKDIQEALELPENYTSLSSRLNYMKRKMMIENRKSASLGNRGKHSEWRITEHGLEILETESHLIQDPSDYDLKLFAVTGKRQAQQTPEEPAQVVQEQMFSPAANSAMDDMSALIEADSSLEIALVEIATIIDKVEIAHDIEQLLLDLGLDAKTIKVLPKTGLFSGVVSLYENTKIKLATLQDIRALTEDVIEDEQE